MKLGNNKCVFCIPIVAVTCGELGKQAGIGIAGAS